MACSVSNNISVETTGDSNCVQLLLCVDNTVMRRQSYTLCCLGIVLSTQKHMGKSSVATISCDIVYMEVKVMAIYYYNVHLVPETQTVDLLPCCSETWKYCQWLEKVTSSKSSNTLDFLEYFSISNADSTVFLLIC